MAGGLVITSDPKFLKAVLVELYPDPAERAVVVKKLRFLAQLADEDKKKPGPRMDKRDAVREAEAFGLKWERAYKEGRTGNWDMQHDLEAVLEGINAALSAVPTPAGVVGAAVTGVAKSVMKLTPVQDYFGLERTLEAKRWERGLIESTFGIDDDVEYIVNSCLNDRLCAQWAVDVAPRIAGGRDELPVRPQELVFEHGEVFDLVVREAARVDGTLVIDPAKLKEALLEDFADLKQSVADGTAAVREELAQMRSDQETVLGWARSQMAAEEERRRSEELNRRRTEIVRAAEPVLIEAQGSLQVITSLMSLADPKLAGDVARVGGAVIQVARTGTELVQVASNIANGLTAVVGAGAMAATGNFIGAAVALVGLFTAGGPSPEELILQEVRELREDMRDLRDDMSGRFDRIDQSLDRIYTDVIKVLDTIDIDNERLREKVDDVLDALEKQREILTRVERSLLAYFREAERDELKRAMDTGLGRPDRSGNPEMTVAEYLEFEGAFYGWATRRCQENIESPVTGRNRDNASLAIELAAPTAGVADNLAIVVAAARDRGWPGAVRVPVGRGIPNPETWAMAAGAFSQLESEWPALAAQVNSANPGGRRNEIRANGKFLSELLGRLVDDVDDQGRNSLMRACDELTKAASELGGELEESAVRWEDERMLADKAAGRPYVPAWTPPDAKPGWDYAPDIKVMQDNLIALGSLPPEVALRMPATLRAVAAFDHPEGAYALATAWYVDEPGSLPGSARAYLSVEVRPGYPVEVGDNAPRPDPGPPALVYRVRARNLEQKPPDARANHPNLWVDNRWSREWSPALAAAGSPEVTDLAVIDGLRAYVRGSQRVRCEDSTSGVYKWLSDELPSPSTGLAPAAAAYMGSLALLDTLIALAMPVQREYHDVVRATLDGLPMSVDGIAIPDIHALAAALKTLQVIEGGPEAGGERGHILAEIVTRFTAEPIAVLRESLDQYRIASSAGKTRHRQPTINQSLLRLTVAEGIVQLSLRGQNPSTPTTPRTHTVKQGDTLAAIARTYGVRGGWPTLYAANKDVIGPDPDKLKVGVMLKVPPV